MSSGSLPGFRSGSHTVAEVEGARVPAPPESPHRPTTESGEGRKPLCRDPDCRWYALSPTRRDRSGSPAGTTVMPSSGTLWGLRPSYGGFLGGRGRLRRLLGPRVASILGNLRGRGASGTVEGPEKGL